jgi:hypothetical protein
MKYAVLLIALSLGFVFNGCKDKETPTEPEIVIKIQVTDSMLFKTGGDFSFEIDATDITASVVLIGAGGGGGGGVTRTQTGFSTGGGGGGGAGQIVVIDSISLIQNNTYSVQVGLGGNAGLSGNSGSSGLISTFASGTTILHTALAGNGGESNVVNSRPGGDGGTGFPYGGRGGSGDFKGTFSSNEPAGRGGFGAFNQSGFGSGGDGGVGTAIKNFLPVDPESGSNGSYGYVKIVWTGLVDK